MEEIAEFLASSPIIEELLKYHPSEHIQQRASELLGKNRESRITAEEQQELDQFAQAEAFMQLVRVKALLRQQKAP
jgi:hypothetical protein